MEELIKTRRLLTKKAIKLEGEYNDNSEFTEIDINVNIDRINELIVELNNVHGKINLKCNDENEMKSHDKIYDQYEANLYDTKKKWLTKKQQLCETIHQRHYRPTLNQADVKLPQLDLPVFNGNIQEWPSFKDLFVASVHNNQTLSNAQKLQYLKAALKNEAANIIKSFQITDANYEEAWNLINDRYENKREIINSYLELLINQPVLTQESATGIRRLVDTSNECVRALKVQKVPIEHWDVILIFIVTKKLDLETKRQWELSLKKNLLPSFQQLIDFLDQRARATTTTDNKARYHTTTTTQKPSTKYVVSHVTSTLGCPMCKADHLLNRCEKFVNMSVSDRQKFVKENNLCFNCLRQNHKVQYCRAGGCLKCQKYHHTLLHFTQTENATSPQGTKRLAAHVGEPVASSQVLLATALVNVKDARGQQQLYRALLDSASQINIITEKCAQQLRLQREKTSIPIVGISGETVCNSRGSVSLTISSRTTASSYNTFAMILPKVTDTMPSTRLEPNKWHHINPLNLADPQFNEPNKIDLLLGAEIFSEILGSGRRKGAPNEPVALETTLGWIVLGRIDRQVTNRRVVLHAQCNLEATLQQFWELERISTTKPVTIEEKHCEEHFATNHSRDEDGRYMVKLPCKPNIITQLGDSRQTAVKRLLQTERHLCNTKQKREQYIQFMREYVELGHAEVVPHDEQQEQNQNRYYLPHHAVMKDGSTTTKLRVVFDASAPSSSGISLNDALMVGPKLQEDVLTLLLRFRTHIIALTADIEKMYRQIRVHPSQTDLQRIVWREGPELPIQDLRLLTVTYGTTCGHYLAVKSLQQVAKDEQKTYPRAAKVVLQDFFVDDLLSGTATEQEAIQLREELTKLLKRGGFVIRKWSTNNKRVLESIPKELRATDTAQSISDDKMVKTLGIQWHPTDDFFTYTMTQPAERTQITKRTLLSDMAKLFDPVGWLAPFTIRVKILFQLLWKEQLKWDDPLTEELQYKWLQYKKELLFIEEVKIPRCMIPEDPYTIQLHGYCDASEAAYAAVVYLRVVTRSKTIKVTLVAAKTRVAPIKKITLPRLELCGAMLLAETIQVVLQSLNLEIERICAWCDSTITLAWIKSQPTRWKTFVGNRVAAIQEIVPPPNWRHIASDTNPADCATRGLDSQKLVTHSLWWNGPPQLQNPNLNLDSEPEYIEHETSEELKVQKSNNQVFLIHVTIDLEFIKRFSSFSKLYRTVAQCYRFVTNCKIKQKSQRISSNLTLSEINSAIKNLIKLIQQTEFKHELNNLANNKHLNIKSKLLKLCPFIDEDGILRVGGRICAANLPYDKKHPILLPQTNHFTTLLVEYEHKRLCHAGPQLLSNSLREKYWILGARNLIKNVVHKCVICHRNRNQTISQLMGNLPIARITPSRPFSTCGVDYAGPFVLKIQHSRVRKTYKAYVSLFICFATKATHLELVSDQTSEAFIAAFKRFVARRGRPAAMVSDCGTNFVGANHELQDCSKWLRTQEVRDFLCENQIEWNFNPPSAPHFGGLWEAGVKSMKHHLRRVVGNSILNFEEMVTVLCQIEACLNSRPMTPLSDDPNDLSALTPGHFLIGEPLTSLPERQWTEIKMNKLSKWQLLQKLNQDFWRRWSKEYLSQLQQRPKWLYRRESVKIGDLVLIKDDNQPPLAWKLGRIIETQPGTDGLVRSVTLKTANGQIQRPIVKLSPLPC